MKEDEVENVPLREEHGGPNWARIKRDIKAEVLFQKVEKPPRDSLARAINDPSVLKKNRSEQP